MSYDFGEKITIFAEGHGFGHAARMYNLAVSINAEIITFGDAVRFFKEKNFPVVEIEKPYSLVFNEQEFDLTKSFGEMLKLFDVNTVKKVISSMKDSSLVVVDSSLLGFVVAKFLGKKTIFISNSTDVSVFFKGKKANIIGNSVNSLISKADKILVCDFPPPYTISLDNIKLDSLDIEFIGPLVSVEDLKKGKKLKEKHGIISAGALEDKLLKELFNSVKNLDLGYKVLTRHPFNEGNVKRVENIRDYYKNAEWIITHGGHSTIMESILLGIPLIIIADKAYAERYNNALGVERNNLGKLVLKEYLSPLIIEKAIEDALAKKEDIKRFSKWANKFNGVERVKNTISELIE